MVKTTARKENDDANPELEQLLKEIEENKTLINKEPDYWIELKQKKRLSTGYNFLDDSENKKTGLYDEDLIFIAGNQADEYKTDFSRNLAFNLANKYKKRNVYYFFEGDGDYTREKLANLSKSKKVTSRIINIRFDSTEELTRKLDLIKNQLNEKDIVFIDNFANHIQINHPGSSGTWKKHNAYTLLISKIILMKRATKTTIILVTNKTKEFKLSKKEKETQNIGQDIHGGDQLRTYTQLQLYVRLARKERIIIQTIRKENNYYAETLLNANPETCEVTEVHN